MLNDFKAIEKLNGRYEINSEGILRNVRTRYIRKPYKNGQAYYFKINGLTLSRNKLLKKLHKIEPDYRFFRKVAVRISKSRETHCFNTITACAEFLSPIIFYSENTLRKYMARRARKIGNWTVTYEVAENV